MPKKWILAVLVAIVLLCALVSAEDMECSSADGKYVTSYNPADLAAVLGAEAFCREGIININLPLGTRQWEAGYVYGKLTANVPAKKILVENGGFVAKDHPLETLRDMDLKVNVTGERFLIDASGEGKLSFDITKGAYSRSYYFLACDSESCRLKAMLNRTSSTADLSGKGLAIFGFFLKDYLNSQPIDDLMKTNISDLSGIEIENTTWLTMTAKSTARKSRMGNIEFSSDETVGLRRYYSVKLNPVSVSGTTKAGYIDMVFARNAEVFGKEGIHFGAVSYNENDNAGGINVYVGKDNLFQLRKGSIFLFSSEEIYTQCATGSADSLKLDKAICGYVKSADKTIKIKPWRSERRIGEEAPSMLIVNYPVGNAYDNLEIKDFERDDAESKIIVQKQGAIGKEIVFSRDDVTVNEGTNWYDLETSFKTYIYDSAKNDYGIFECLLPTKACYLDGTLVSGFQRISAENRQRCRTNADCGEGRACSQRVCIKARECKDVELYGGISDSSRAIDIVFVSDYYDRESDFLSDVNAVIKGDAAGHIGLLTVEPFKSNAHKFKFSTIFTGDSLPQTEYIGWLDMEIPTERYVNSLARSCSGADRVIVLSNRNFRSFANFQRAAFVSTALTGRQWTGPTVVHEFGHSFGELKDEYYESGSGSIVGKPNCLNERQARNFWGNELTEEAITGGWRGCGGPADSIYANYLKPSENSIMNTQLVPGMGGVTFNRPCTDWLNTKLGVYG